MTRIVRDSEADGIDSGVEGATLRAPTEDIVRRLPTIWTQAAFAAEPRNAVRANVVNDRGVDRPGD